MFCFKCPNSMFTLQAPDFFRQGQRVGAIFGDGTYFARDAKKSDEGPYACTLADGRKQMLVAEVIDVCDETCK